MSADSGSVFDKLSGTDAALASPALATVTATVVAVVVGAIVVVVVAVAAGEVGAAAGAAVGAAETIGAADCSALVVGDASGGVDATSGLAGTTRIDADADAGAAAGAVEPVVSAMVGDAVAVEAGVPDTALLALLLAADTAVARRSAAIFSKIKKLMLSKGFPFQSLTTLVFKRFAHGPSVAAAGACPAVTRLGLPPSQRKIKVRAVTAFS